MYLHEFWFSRSAFLIVFFSFIQLKEITTDFSKIQSTSTFIFGVVSITTDLKQLRLPDPGSISVISPNEFAHYIWPPDLVHDYAAKALNDIS
jgi:hypothetical protein